MTSDDALAEAIRLVRHTRATGTPAGFTVEADMMPRLVSRLASLAAGLLEDAARLGGDDPEAMLDEIEIRRMERSLR